jgi:hypothetical protein
LKQYDPFHNAPAPSEWLELDEGTRIDLVLAHHANVEVELPNEQLHAAMHVIVENQLALEVEPVPATIQRLVRQGLDRHEAVHAIGAVLSENIYAVLSSEEGKLDQLRTRNRLNKLTAKRWRKGKW